MSFLTDLRAVSEGVVEQVAGRFTDLPRPLLAAIGAGDVAVERLAELREQLRDALPGTEELAEVAKARNIEDVRSLAGHLPAKAQQAAAGVASSIEQYLAQAPAKAQELVAELPTKVAEFSQALSPETVRETLEAYTQLAGHIYGNLADRGETAWEKVVGSGLIPGAVVEQAAPKPAAKPAATKPAAATKPTRAAATPRATAKSEVKAKPATRASKPATTAATPTAATSKAATPKAATPKTAAKAAAPKTAETAAGKAAAAEKPVAPAAES